MTELAHFDFKGLVIILMSAVFVNNYVLLKFLGICPFLGVSIMVDHATCMCISSVSWAV